MTEAVNATIETLDKFDTTWECTRVLRVVDAEKTMFCVIAGGAVAKVSWAAGRAWPSLRKLLGVDREKYVNKIFGGFWKVNI